LAKKAGANYKSVANWRNPVILYTPANIIPLLKTFYGDDPRYAAQRQAMLRLWRQARGYDTDDLATFTVPPSPPATGPASVLVATPKGYEIRPQPNRDEERADPVQVMLHANIRKQIAALQGMIDRIGNEHPLLAAEFTDYAALVQVGMDALDVPAIWSAGSGLAEMVARVANANGTMTPPLEPEPLAILHSLIRNNIAFVQGFEAGRAMTKRVTDFQTAAMPSNVFRGVADNVLRAMLSVPGLLATNARHLLLSITRALDEAPSVALQLLVAAGETARNGVISIGRSIQSVSDIIQLSDQIKLGLMIAGVQHPEVLEPAVMLFREHSSTLLGLSAMDPQITGWLEWLITAVRDDQGPEDDPSAPVDDPGSE